MMQCPKLTNMRYGLKSKSTGLGTCCVYQLVEFICQSRENLNLHLIQGACQKSLSGFFPLRGYPPHYYRQFEVMLSPCCEQELPTIAQSSLLIRTKKTMHIRLTNKTVRHTHTQTQMGKQRFLEIRVAYKKEREIFYFSIMFCL